jgi:hypothetical protein
LWPGARAETSAAQTGCRGDGTIERAPLDTTARSAEGSLRVVHAGLSEREVDADELEAGLDRQTRSHR